MKKYRLLHKATAVVVGFNINLAINKRRHIFRKIIANYWFSTNSFTNLIYEVNVYWLVSRNGSLY